MKADTTATLIGEVRRLTLALARCELADTADRNTGIDMDRVETARLPD